MKMKTIILFLTISFLSFKTITQVDEQTKSKMFCLSLNNSSTAPNYVVVIVKNLNTGEKKEICTEVPLLIGAVNNETGKFSTSLDCMKFKNRYFEFSKISALENIGFNLYSKTELDSFAKTIDIADTVDSIKNGKLMSKTFIGEKKEQIMFAQLMFNNGVMISRGCWAGNICELTYFEQK
jgi:hypothetical protein